MMKKYWLYLEPYTFVFEGRQGAIVYNSINGESIKVSNTSNLLGIIEELNGLGSGYCILLEEEQLNQEDVFSFVNDIREKFLGDIVDISVSNGKPFIFKPILDLLEDPAKIEREKGFSLRENVLEYLHEITIFVGDTCPQNCENCEFYSKQGLFCTKIDKKQELSMMDYIFLITRLKTIGIKKINVVCNGASSDVFMELIEYLEACEMNVFIYIYYKNIAESFLDFMHSFDHCFFVVLADKYIDLSKVCKIGNEGKISYDFYVSSISEYLLLSALADECCLKANFYPFYNGSNDSFMREYVYLLKEDILEQKLSKRNIFGRQVFNENLFGKLIIMPNGESYSNLNRDSLGNIKTDTMNKLVYNELEKKDTWLFTRSIEPCLSCVFRYLCPSPNNYEIFMGKMNLCNIGD